MYLIFECIYHGDSKYSYDIPECWYFLHFCKMLDLSSAHACHVVKCYDLRQIFYNVLLLINQPKLGMFVLIWMHLSWWFQIQFWNSRILTFLDIFVTFSTCRLLTPACVVSVKIRTLKYVLSFLIQNQAELLYYFPISVLI